MREITHEELKQIQLGILDKVHDFCEKNGITYFLSSGTLIGAVRHKGYIPWDDDLDLYMPRADYDKFIKLFSANSPENTKLLSLETDEKYHACYAKIIDDRTELVEQAYGETFKTGVYVDLFPLENVPDGDFKFIIWYAVGHILKMFAAGAASAKARGRHWIWTSSTLLKKLTKFFLYPVFCLFPLRCFLKTYDSFIRKNKTLGKYVYNMGEGIGVHGAFRRSSIDRSIEIEFEGKRYKTMQGYEEYLCVTYGNYMELPPAEKQISHHHFRAWWKG